MILRALGLTEAKPFAAGLRAFVGENGGGKTLGAMACVVGPALKRGYPVLSNADVDPTVVGADPSLFIPLVTWPQIMFAGVLECWNCNAYEPFEAVCPSCGEDTESITGNRPCVLMLDEISSCLPHRQTLNVPPELQRVLDQFRKQMVCVVVTAPSFYKIDKNLRTNIQLVTMCSGRWPDKYRRGYVDGRLRRTGRWRGPWPPWRLFSFEHYRAFEFENFDKATMQQVAPVAVAHHWRTSRWNYADRLYRTAQRVRLLDLVDGGWCAHCGKLKKEERCTGKHGESAPAAGRRRVADPEGLAAFKQVVAGEAA